MFCGARVVVGRGHSERRHVVKKLGGKSTGELLKGHALASRFGDGLVVYVGEVDDVADLIAGVAQYLLENIDDQESAYQTDVGEIVQGRTTGIDADAPFIVGAKDTFASRAGVVELEHGAELGREKGGGQVALAKIREDDDNHALVE